MPFYFIYKIIRGPTELVKTLEKINCHVSYKEAKQQVRDLRNTAITAQEDVIYKIIFSESELEAEETLSEKREAPVIREWEK